MSERRNSAIAELAELKALADLEALAPRPPKTPEEAAADRKRQLEAMGRFEEYMTGPPSEDLKP